MSKPSVFKTLLNKSLTDISVLNLKLFDKAGNFNCCLENFILSNIDTVIMKGYLQYVTKSGLPFLTEFLRYHSVKKIILDLYVIKLEEDYEKMLETLKDVEIIILRD